MGRKKVNPTKPAASAVHRPHRALTPAEAVTSAHSVALVKTPAGTKVSPG